MSCFFRSSRRCLLTIINRPVEIINATSSLISTLPDSFDTFHLSSLVPSQTVFSTLYFQLNISAPSPSLSILSPLISQSPHESLPSPLTEFDSENLSGYARAVLSLLEVSVRDRAWLKTHVWVLPHVLLLGDVARDESSDAESRSGVFGPGVERSLLERIVSACEGLASYLLSSVANDLGENWHAEAVGRLRKKGVALVEEGKNLESVLDLLGREGIEEGVKGAYRRRAFVTVLQATLRYTEKTVVDAERWLAYAQSLPEGESLLLFNRLFTLLTKLQCRLRTRPRHYLWRQGSPF